MEIEKAIEMFWAGLIMVFAIPWVIIKFILGIADTDEEGKPLKKPTDPFETLFSVLVLLMIAPFLILTSIFWLIKGE